MIVIIDCLALFQDGTMKFLYETTQPYSGWAFLGLLTDRGNKKPQSSLPKICHTNPTMMKLGTVIPYLKKT